MIGVSIVKKIRIILFGFLILVINGCVTGYKEVREGDHSLNIIIQAAESVMPGGTRLKSDNGREIESYYFNRFDPEMKINPESAQERSFVKIRILGDRKPYDIELGVFVERLDGGRYKLAGHDEHLGDFYAKWLTDRLAKSRGELNAIDVFKPF
jgi:hypothetical protein